VPSTAFIFARGGSKGLPGKNIRPLAGKPLIGWAIEQALAANGIERVVVSTDSEDIAEVAKAFGAEVPFLRPQDLANDTAPEVLAWRHALNFLEATEGKYPEKLISVPATAPLRLPSDIDSCIVEFERSNADVVITMAEAYRNPWFNMVQRLDDGTYGLIEANDGRRYVRRQDAPSVFDITTVAYVVRSSFIMKNDSLFAGIVSAVRVPVERSIDIDTMHDFEIAEFLMKKRLSP